MADTNEQKLAKLRQMMHYASATSFGGMSDSSTGFSNMGGTGYTKSDIIDAIENGDLETLREFSSFLFLSNSYYRIPLLNIEGGALMNYVLTPNFSEEVDETTTLENHILVSGFADQVLNKRYLREMLSAYLLFGAYYGYIRESSGNYYIQRLDHNYCRIAYQIDGLDVVEFNMDYFEDADDEKFEYFPPEFKTLYNTASGEDDMWIELDVTKTIPITTYNEYPILSGSFASFLDEDTSVSLTMESLSADNMKMINMHIPTDPETGEVLADIDTVNIFLQMIIDSIDDSISVTMSPYKLEFNSFEDNKMSASTDKRDYLKKRMMESSISAPALFGDTTTLTGFKTYYRMLESIIQGFYDKVEYVFERMINNSITNSSIPYRLEFINVTSWNKDDYYAASKEMLNYGGSVTIPAMISTGLSMNGYLNLLKLESLIGAKDLLEVPQTSSTLSSDGEQGVSENDGEVTTEEGEQSQNRGDEE